MSKNICKKSKSNTTIKTSKTQYNSNRPAYPSTCSCIHMHAGLDEPLQLQVIACIMSGKNKK